jgi:ABC-type multidrug transport system fused ATPase/permease subunit
LVFPVPPDGIADTACRNFISLYAIMNIILLPAGIIAGAVIGYLTAGRKAAALKTQVEVAGEREALLNRTAEERIARERSIAEERLQEAARQASERLDAQERLFAERLAEQAHSFNERLAQQERSFGERIAQQQRQWEQRLAEQKEEAEALHKRMNTEFENLSFTLRQGEVLGFYGLVGAGRTELARLIFGADPRTSGTVRLDGKEIDVKEPLDAIKLGIGYLPEDRKGQGLFLQLSALANTSMPLSTRCQ